MSGHSSLTTVIRETAAAVDSSLLQWKLSAEHGRLERESAAR